MQSAEHTLLAPVQRAAGLGHQRTLIASHVDKIPCRSAGRMKALYSWAEALAERSSVTREQVAVLVETCRESGGVAVQQASAAPSGPPRVAPPLGGASPVKDPGNMLPPATTSEAQVGAALPLCAFLIKSGGKFAENVVPRLLRCLDDLWDPAGHSHSTSSEWQALLAELLRELRGVMQLPGLRHDFKDALSARIQQLLLAALAQPTTSRAASFWRIATGKAIRDPEGEAQGDDPLIAGLRRALVQLEGPSQQLPLLPEHAAAMLGALCESHFGGGSGADSRPHHDGPLDAAVLAVAKRLAGMTQEAGLLQRDIAAQLLQFSCRSLRDALRPILSSADGADSGASDGEPTRPNRLPSSACVGSAARLACSMALHLWEAVEPSERAARPESADQLSSVADLMLEVAEACLSFCWELGAGEAASEQVLGLALVSSREVERVLLACSDASLPVLSDFEARLRSLMLSSARLSEGELLRRTADLQPNPEVAMKRVWRWDLTESTLALPAGPGRAAQQLCRTLAEALCSVLAGGWRAGRRSSIKATFVPLSDLTSFSGAASTAAEQQAVLLTLGRLGLMLEGDETLVRLALPLLVDSDLPNAPPQVDACAMHVLAAIGTACAQHGCRWGFEQAIDLLVKIYKSTDGRMAMHLLHSSKTAACPGALADALLSMAEGLQDAPRPIRQDFQMRILSLFADYALIMPPDARGLADLGGLLPAIAAASEGMLSPAASLLSHQSSMSYDALQKLQEEDVNLVKLFRLLWLYASLYNFAGVGRRRERANWPRAWRAALGQISQASPLTLVGGGEDSTEKLEAELGERLQRLGPRASSPALAGALLESTGKLGMVADMRSTARNAHLLIVATINLCRVEVAKLPVDHQLVPIAPILAAQQLTLPKNWQAGWLAAITERAFELYCERLRGTAPQFAADDPDTLTTCCEALAQVLIDNLTRRSGNPDVARLANRLLLQLLAAFPSLYWSRAVLLALLDAVEADEDSNILAAPSAAPPSWSWTQQLIKQGAKGAPGVTEALLHERVRDDPAPASPAAVRHAAALMSIYGAAASEYQLAGLQGPAVGVQAMNRKAHYIGLVSGLASLAEAAGEPSGRVPQQVAASLQRAATAQAPAKLLQDRYLQAAAALILYPDSLAAHDLLRMMCWVPAHAFTPDMMRLATFAWHWVVAGAPKLQVQLLSEVVDAWLWTVDHNVGLFDDSFSHKTGPGSGDGRPRDSNLAAGDSIVDGVIAHHIWLSYLLETWQVFSAGSSSQARAVTIQYGRLLQQSLKDPQGLTHQPASSGARFRLLLLALRYCHQMQAARPNQPCPLPVMVLFERILQAALQWFRAPPAWYGRWTIEEAREEAYAVTDFAAMVDAVTYWPTLPREAGRQAGGAQPHPVWGTAQADNQERVALLQFLLKGEAERLNVWAAPLSTVGVPKSYLAATSPQQWVVFTRTAWDTDPRLALALLERFSCVNAVRSELERLVGMHAHEPAIQELPGAACILAGACPPGSALLDHLAHWAPMPLLQAMALMSGASGRNPAVRAYALRSLLTCPPEQVAFFLPQLVQLLRGDDNHQIEEFLLSAATRSVLFAHHLICTLKSEGTPPAEARDPPVKRAGWTPPADTGLWRIADLVAEKVWRCLPPDKTLYLRAELAFFDEVTSVSGQLFPVPKDERKAAAMKIVKRLKLPRADLYLPTNPDSRVLSIISESATPMQSAAKVPLLVAFKVEEQLASTKQERVQACIFKVGDDCRQDVLALQVISLLKDALQKAGLGLYLAPYGVLPTGYECGIIEVVPNAKSRSALGETADGGLFDIFRREFGAPGTVRFERARHNFIVSSAGYAIASYLLQSKDRHNGNILIDAAGHLVHIDFGFILEISPGGNLGFESAAFKLSHEMTQLLDPGGACSSPQFHLFEELCIRGFLAARGIAEGIIATVALMSESGLPCFGRGQPVANLRKRLHLEMTDAQAATFMRNTILDAYDKWTTGFYDFIQYMQNAIPK
ncbi:hypothetical protein WJX72_002251 [[Myrmecia] bisecta]|uniref:1-phosphatidylinositol 4-kinase n=1 Tax=[Myrmecia] bisecta TaxID=41462 RepID=A0AAW1PVQ7_9CHLO